MPKLVAQDGHYALMVDGAPYLMLGAQIHNSSAWPGMMAKVWPTLEAMQVNTMEAPVYWEAMEPSEGKYDFAQADMLVAQAREHSVRLVLLWFGTWKNGSGHYIPEWMKRDEAKYPHVVNEKGRTVDSLSPHAPATLAADKRAFAALMRHLKATDGTRHTVILVQVENETGTYGSMRDYSAAGNTRFEQEVPGAVRTAMKTTKTGTWEAVFGDEADEFFHAWSIARYVDEVAAAGKAEYGLPMYTNAALRDPISPGRQGHWENGAPTDDVLPIWKVGAPSLDLLAPDIYMDDHARYTKVLDLYARPDNALLVPETGSGPAYARYCFAVIGRGGLGFSPFGVDATGAGSDPNAVAGAKSEDRYAQFNYNYEVLRPVDRLIARLNFEGKVKGSAEQPTAHVEELAFGDWTAVVQYGRPQFGNGGQPVGNTPPTGEALVAQMGPAEFLVMAYHARVDFRPKGAVEGASASGPQRQFLKVEEGTYVDGVWKALRIWNGDETDYGLNFRTSPVMLRVTLATY